MSGKVMEQDELILDGKWCYRSFYNDLQQPDEPIYMQAWAPRGELTARATLGGQIAATLRFGSGVVLDVTGWTTTRVAGVAAQPGTPAGVMLKAEGCGARYELRGFMAASKVIVGTVRCMSGDLRNRPDGTLGPFVLLQT